MVKKSKKKNCKKVHFVGIKGAGMSALAQIYHDEGWHVAGTDIEDPIFTEEGLIKKNIPYYSFEEFEVERDVEYIVGNAFGSTHPVVQTLDGAGIVYKRYHEVLSERVKNTNSVAVCGTHGKTSTTSLLSTLWKNVAEVSSLIGDGRGEGFEVYEKDYFVFEACEYRNHFLSYKPKRVLLTNIEHDHPDYFKDLAQTVKSYESFLRNSDATPIACGDDPGVKEMLGIQYLTYGINLGNDYSARSVNYHNQGTTFDLYYQDGFLIHVNSPLFGKHQLLNLLGVLALSHQEGLNLSRILEKLPIYEGAKRRFSIEKVKSYTIVDDYAHHPTEIKATLTAVRQRFPNQKVIAIFQPHTYTRTKLFADGFTDSLTLADHVVGCDIFGSARESEGNIKTEDLLVPLPSREMWSNNTPASLSQCENSVFVFMGAGDIGIYKDQFLNRLKENVS